LCGVFLKEFGKHGRSTRGLFFLRFESNYQAPTDMTEMIRGFSSEFVLKMNGHTEPMTGWFVCLFVKRGFAT